MSVTGLCGVCERPGADRRCDRCGRIVCDHHFEDGAGVCSECAADLGGAGRVDPENRPDGVDTYRF